MQKIAWLITLLVLATAAVIPAQGPPGGSTVPDVVESFNKLQIHGDALGIHRGVGQDPDLCRHYQGLARWNGPDGTPYFILTRSGNAGLFFCDDGASDRPGELLIVEMGSRPKHRERMRSNRLSVGANMDNTRAPSEDKGVKSIFFDDNNEFGVGRWDHLGDGQVVDGVFVLTLEHRDTDQSDGAIMFIDVRDPRNPVKLDYELMFDGEPGNFSDQHVGVAAITKEPDTGKYLMVFTHGDSKNLQFWESVGTDLFSPDLLFTKIFEMNVDQAGVPNWEKWQNLDFIRQTPDAANPNGRLFLAAADNVDAEDDNGGTNWIRLFEVVRNNGNSFTLIYRAERHLNVDSPFLGNCAAGNGFYVSPQGNLLMYLCEHDNKGPDDTIRAAEFRSYDVSQSGATVTGHPWVELYQDDEGWDPVGGPKSRDRSLMMDTIDIADDDFWHNLDNENGWGDEPDSVRFWAPAGTKVMFFKNADYGGAVLPYAATGSVQVIDDLDFASFGDAIHSVFAGSLAVGDDLPITSLVTGLSIMDALGAQGPALRLQVRGGTVRQGFPTLANPLDDPVIIEPAPGQVTTLTP